MTISFRLGLIGYDLSGTAQPKPISQSGDGVDLEVEYWLDSLSDVKALRQQILGYSEPGRTPVLPLVWSDDSDFDGYYRLTSASIVTDHGLYLARRVVAQFQLERIQGYSLPVIESIYSGANRKFAVAESGVTPWISVPSSWVVDSETLGYLGFSDIRLLSTTLGMRLTTTGAGALWAASLSSRAAPSEFYDGAVMFRSGTDLNVQTGRQIVSNPTLWSLDNGLVRISNSIDAASQLTMETRLADGSAWSSRKKKLIVTDNGDDWGYLGSVIVAPESVTVVRITPEEVAVSLFYPYNVVSAASSGTVGGASVQVSLRRGARIANVSISSTTARKFGLRYTNWSGVGTKFANSGGATLNGVREPAVDADNQKALIMIGSAGLSSATSGTVFSFTDQKLIEVGIGCEVVPGAAEDVSQALLSQYLAAHTETQRVVSQ